MLGPQAQAQYFTYERVIEGSTVHVGAMGAPQASDADGVSIATTVATPDDPAVDCGTADASSDSSIPQAVVGDEVVIGDEDSADDPCRAADTVAIKIFRYYSDSTDELPVAIKIVEEAPVTDPGEPLADDEELDYAVPEPAEPSDAPVGAGSFADAPIIDAGDGPVTIAAEVTEGTEVLWRVPLDWGDQLVVRGDLRTVPSDDPLSGVQVQLHLVQPSRDVFGLTKSDDYTYGYFGADQARLLAASYPLRYSNRFSDLEPTLPGDHWVAVSVQPPPEDRAARDAPVRLTFAVTRTDAAAPAYRDAVLGPGGEPGPDGYSADEPFVVGDGKFAAVASGNPFTPDGDEDDAWWGARRAIGVGVGAAGLGCCLVGALWLSRRRAR